MRNSVGLVGWRGMVGSVLMERMEKENDFSSFNPVFFSTSQIHEEGPTFNGKYYGNLKNAYDIDILKELDIIVTCQGSEYTNKIYYKLRKSGWKGYWIDAASYLRMKKESVIVLDPINLSAIHQAIDNNCKTFIGGNCTVSLMLLSLGGLFSKKLIDWMTVSTYQAASGSGASHMVELLMQMNAVCKGISSDLKNPAKSILKIEKKINKISLSDGFPTNCFHVPLVGNLIPWIDIKTEDGRSKEEWKIQSEANKILLSEKNIPIDGLCVRIGSLRCHSQSFVIKLKKDISLSEIEKILSHHNRWTRLIPNDVDATIKNLTPLSVTGTLFTPVGRVRKLNIGKKYISAFTVGDQLLWGAAEPLRRMLKILVNQKLD
ncbi:MAG: aspartate-semialdehyde dehydrogenase [Buchnera aphidicola (Nurudea ibofushi)]